MWTKCSSMTGECVDSSCMSPSLFYPLTDSSQPRKNVPFQREGVSKVDLDDLSQYLMPVGNAHIGKLLA